jgi:hypothetical protein
MSDVKFVIYSPGYQFNSGGLIALSMLAHNLASIGEQSYVIGSKGPGNLGEELQGRRFDPESTIMVYPEIVYDNPFNYKHIVRWILNSSHRPYPENDYLFKYSDYFTSFNEHNVKGKLTAYNLELDFWIDLNYERSGECYIVKKGSYKKLIHHKDDSICIDDFPNNEYIREVFNKTKRFICYDSESFLATQASMCGCDVVVIPRDGVSREDWKYKFQGSKYGIAYGFDDPELYNSTRHLIKDNLIRLQSESIEQTKQFVEICKGKLGIV